MPRTSPKEWIRQLTIEAQGGIKPANPLVAQGGDMKEWFVSLVLVVSVQDLIARPVESQSIPDEKNNFLELGYSSPPLTSLEALGGLDFSFGRTDFKLWNSSYWPTHKGIAAVRYNDPSFPDSDDWQTNLAYYHMYPSYTYVDVKTDQLSPAEKYDLLIGDSEWHVTEKMWAKGQAVMNTYGRVPKWFGFCHGWNGAAHTGVPEPLFPVKVLSADGAHEIVFYPQDIKALLTWLWAESAPKSLFVGQRCKNGNPDRDEFGRIKDSACFDSNPKTWHLAVVNRVGKDRQSFVMDAESSSEVWNYSVDSYFFRYFDPKTLKPVRLWREALVSRESFGGDPYKNFRAAETTYIVGVMMDVFYPKAIVPTSHASSGNRLLDRITYIYDLEMDSQMNIIGGEWYSKERPDFIWAFEFGAQAHAVQDLRVSESWNIGSALPLEWADLGKQAGKNGKVLASIVNRLLEESLLATHAVDLKVSSQ